MPKVYPCFLIHDTLYLDKNVASRVFDGKDKVKKVWVILEDNEFDYFRSQGWLDTDMVKGRVFKDEREALYELLFY